MAEDNSDTNKISSNYFMELSIDGNVVPNKTITYLAVREWVFDEQRLPRLEMTMLDDGYFSDVVLPYQGKKIEIYLSRDISEQDSHLQGTYLQSTFMIVDFTYTKATNDSVGNPSTINITGYLDCTDIVTQLPDKSYDNKTSAEIASEVAGVLGLSFFKKGSPADKMNWISNNYTPLQLLDHVISKSYTEPDDIVFSYVDTNKTLNYISVLEIINGNNIISSKLDKEICELNTKDLIVSKAAAKYDLAEKEAMETLWYSSLDLKSNAGSMFIYHGGYGYTNKSICFSDGKYSITDPKSDNTPNLSVKQTNIQSYKKYLKTSEDPIDSFPEKPLYVGGNVVVMQEKTTDNIYGYDYILADQKRKQLQSILMSQSIIVESSPVVPIKLMDVVDLIVPSNVPTEENNTNAILNGQYIVMGITYLIDKQFYKKIVSLHRVGWNKTSALKD